MDVLQQLETKRRTVDDLCRHLGSRASEAPAYTFLLGAGCSVTSGVRSASELVEQWREEVFRRLYPFEAYTRETAIERFSRDQSRWYAGGREYSSLFEKNFDLPRQRRTFVESEVKDARPSLGYAYLVRLIEAGFSNAVFTTNFDDLLNEAFFQFSSQRPMVCAHDSAVASIAVTSKRPKIVKLHGDFLFDDIKSTLRETESLEENTKNKFAEFGREYGMVVVGYSGADRSVMDVLQYLLRKDEFFKGGIYWCLREGEVPSEELQRLLWRDRVYFVTIDGFDELMAEFHCRLIGDSSPIDTSIVSDRPAKLIQGFCENHYLVNSKSAVIKRDLERFRRQTDREQLLSAFRQVRDEEESSVRSDEHMADAELASLFRIKQLMAAADFSAARGLVDRGLSESSSKAYRSELSDLRVTIEELLGDNIAAISAVDALIEADPNDCANYVRKTRLTPQHDQRMEILAAAEKVNPRSVIVHNRKAECLLAAFNAHIGFDREKLKKEIWSALQVSFQIDPSFRNEAHEIALGYFSAAFRDRGEFNSEITPLVSRANSMDDCHPMALRLRLEALSRFKEDRESAEANRLIEDIVSARKKKPVSDQFFFEMLELEALGRLDRKSAQERKFGELGLDVRFSDRWEYLSARSSSLIRFNGDLDGAIAAQERVVELRPRRAHIFRLAALYEAARNPDGIVRLIDKHAGRLKPTDRSLLQRSAALARSDHQKALAVLRKIASERMRSIDDLVLESHDLIMLRMHDEAIRLLSGALQTLGWSRSDCGPLVVNHELACLRKGDGVNKKRLGDLASSSESKLVQGCCRYLLGDVDRARESLKEAVVGDRELLFRIPHWAIFSDDRGSKFFDSVKKLVT